VPRLSDADRARWRAQALDWLRAERDTCATIFTQGPLEELAHAREALDIPAHHRDLACVRDEDQLKKLPEDERRSWQAFSAEFAALLKTAE
jgi:hypothetical protein